MSADTPKGPAKPFLGDEELSSELDAWDQMFDDLHAGPEGGAPADEAVMAWPAPAPAPSPVSAPLRAPDPELAVGDDASLDAQLTLDQALDDSTLDRPIPDSWQAGVDEADFSDVGAEGAPAALGDMLGAGFAPPPIDDEVFDDGTGETRIMPGGETASRALSPADDDGVYTSASRPSVRAATNDLAIPEEDPIARPPRPAAPPRRTGPAIIRRSSASVPTQKVTPSMGYSVPVQADDGAFSEFGESTRVADFGEIEAKANESRRDARSKAPTAPPPMEFKPERYGRAADDDDEYEIEIGSDPDESAAARPPEPVAPRRTAAHVVRRADKASASPPGPAYVPAYAPARRESEPVIEISGGDAPESHEMSEDDFSDVAVAVGAAPEAFDAHRGFGHEAFEDAAIDDHLPTTALPEEVDLDAVEDVYVQMAPIEVPMPEFALPDEEPVPPAPPPRDRPPALVDLYPRVKRPTSVPILAQVPGGTLDRTLAGDPSALAELRRAVRGDTQLPSYDGAAEIEPMLDLDAIGADSRWPEQLQPLPTAQLDEDAAAMLAIYERELPTIDEPVAAAALHLEAGRLCERLGEADHARAHYDAALLADPRATSALRGLRRLARQSSDLEEATRHLDAELAVAGALERRPLGHYRVDLLLASGDQDLARVAVGEILDSAPSDVRALLAQLELAFLDGRADEFGSALEQLAHAVTDPELRAAVQSARALLAAHHDDAAGAVAWFSAAAESDPSSLGARLGAIREAVAQGDRTGAGRALLELGHHIEASDPATAAALALRAQHWTGDPPAATEAAESAESAESAEERRALASAAVQLGLTAQPGEPIVARVCSETALAAGDTLAASSGLASWSSGFGPAVERAYAAARAAELDPAHGAELWATALHHDPDDDYGSAQLRTAYVAAEAPERAIEVDLVLAADPLHERARLRAAFGLIGQGQLDPAIELLREGRAARPRSLALAEALAEALAAAGRWQERAQVLAELAAEPGEQLDRDVAQLRSALAWEDAVGAVASADEPDGELLQRATTAALEAWQRVLEQRRGSAPSAHAAAITLASRLGDRDVIGETLARAQAAETLPWAASSLALRRARLVAHDDPARADAILSEVAPELDDPRRTISLVLGAVRRGDLGDAATTLDERARQLEALDPGGSPPGGTEVAALRLRAAQLALDANDAPRAVTLLRQVDGALPGIPVIGDLLAAARRRAGDLSGPVTRKAVAPGGAASADQFARLVRDAELVAAQGDGAAALAVYQQALELRPGDPLAMQPLIRLATQLREPAPIAALALAQLRTAEAAGDGPAKAEAYEMLARIDKELRSDAGSAQVALESASQADPTRLDLMLRLEREHTARDEIGALLRLRQAELEQIPSDLGRDRTAMIMDTASLAMRDKRPDAELAELYRQALAADPRRRLALFHLEAIVRRAGASEELARLEEQIAAYFEGDARSQATYYTRAGETLAELGQIDTAVQKFGMADEIQPGHVPALEGWRQAALKGQLWIDVAEAAKRQAKGTAAPNERAALYHFAGVVLMDKALVAEQATSALRAALEADPSHRDAFLRLRILLEENADHDELAILLAKRLAHEPEGPAKLEIHRALAELSRNFLGDRDTAKQHYREILQVDPNDLRAHAAVADIAWEQGAWQEAADALISRARLERDTEVLRTLCFRLGLIYADRLVDVPMALKAFQRALTYQPDDEQTLVRLADLAMQVGEWKLALGACERLVKAEEDADKRAQHLHRVARIFRQGFGDQKRAERALNLALDGAPTSDQALAELVRFYREAGDMTSVRVHLNRVAGTMRVRAAAEPKDGIAYRVISRAMSARAEVGVGGSLAIARAAAELATLLGAADEPERVLLAQPMRVDLAPLLRPEADDVLFPRTAPIELRQIFKLLGDRLAKHVGIDLRGYGVGRGDRLRARDSSVASHAQDVATALGFGEIDVYVSSRQPYAMAVEPTSPVSLVIGEAITKRTDATRAIRFAAGSALKLAHAALAIPARLSEDDLGVLVVALLRLFQPEFPLRGQGEQTALDEGAVSAQVQKLKRLIPSGLLSELRPFAFAIDAQAFARSELARDLRVAGLRAGVVAAGSLLAGLDVLAAQAPDIPSFLADPVAQGLITFALGEDHATLTR
jgi:hypothetical protein